MQGWHWDRPSWIAGSSRPFCLSACWVVLLAAVMGLESCSLPQLQREPRFRVEVFYEAIWTPGENQLGVQIFSSGRRHQALMAYLELESPTGERRRSAVQWQVPGRVASRFELSFQTHQPGLYCGGLRIYEVDGGRLVYQREDVRLLVRPQLEFTHDRSYYTTEEVIRFRGRLNRVEGAGHTLWVELRGNNTSWEQAEQVFYGREVYGELAAASLPPGAYTLKARLYSSEGVEDSVALNFYKHLPGVREVKIDLFTRMLLRDGEPFFPIGLYWLRTEVLGEAKRLRFNAGDYYYKLRSEEIAELMDAAAQEGIDILLELSDFIRRREVPGLQAGHHRAGKPARPRKLHGVPFERTVRHARAGHRADGVHCADAAGDGLGVHPPLSQPHSRPVAGGVV